MLPIHDTQAKSTFPFADLRYNGFVGNLQILKYVTLLYLGWFISILVVTYLGLSLLPNQDFYKKKLYYPSSNLEYFQRWSNWDGGGYRYIADHGYIPRLTVFFPAYPLAIKAFTFLGLDSLRAAFLVSQISTIIALFFFYKLALIDFSEKVAKRALWALLIFPTSFYFMAVYNEALTLASSVGSFYFARKRNWPLSITLASIAATARLTGVAVILGIIAEYLYRDQKLISFSFLWKTRMGRIFSYLLTVIVALSILTEVFRQNQTLTGVLATVLGFLKWPFLIVIAIISGLLIYKSRKLFSIKLFAFLLAFIPLSLYFLYQHLTFGSAFTFLKSELTWGRSISAPWQGPVFNLKNVFLSPLSIGEFSMHMHVQLMVFLVALICLIISCLRLRTSYSVFFLTALIIPLFSGMLADVFRFVLIIFPMFLIFAQVENETVQKIGTLFSALLLGLLSILFINSYFFI